jgi:hypothetical protein
MLQVKPNKIVRCRLCGKKGKTTSKACVVRSQIYKDIVMWKHDGSNGGWECADGHGCKKSVN